MKQYILGNQAIKSTHYRMHYIIVLEAGGGSISVFGVKIRCASNFIIRDIYALSRSSLSCSTLARTALTKVINKACTLSCGMLRYFTLDAITSRCILSNIHTRNCSTPNTKKKIASGGGV
jgi:hypothetical protein